MDDYYLEQLAEAFSRIEFILHALHEKENDWEADPEEEGMFAFKGYVHPPTIGDSKFTTVTSGKMQFLQNPDGSRLIKMERPTPMRPTLSVLDEHGTDLGDIVDIAIKARASWLQLLEEYGYTFQRASEGSL
jgi:hypothetical protein